MLLLNRKPNGNAKSVDPDANEMTGDSNADADAARNAYANAETGDANEMVLDSNADAADDRNAYANADTGNANEIALDSNADAADRNAYANANSVDPDANEMAGMSMAMLWLVMRMRVLF